VLETDAPYIGVIGSRRRWAIAVKELEAIGIKQEALNRIYAPIGLLLGEETPEEIAVSIMSQIILLRNRGEVGAAYHRRDPES
jgi:xanthine dehydrogenase accessory factor